MLHKSAPYDTVLILYEAEKRILNLGKNGVKNVPSFLSGTPARMHIEVEGFQVLQSLSVEISYPLSKTNV